MFTKFRGFLLFAVAAAVSLAGGGAAQAHFPWLDADDEGRVLVFFGESPTDRTYHMPESIADAAVVARAAEGEPAPVSLDAAEEEEFIGRRSAKPAAKDAALEMSCQYGIYHGMLLTYYAQHLPGKDAAAWNGAGGSKLLKLQITPQASEDPRELRLVATWEGQPRQDVDVAVVDAAEETHEGKTNDKGEVVLKGVASGPLGVTANFMVDAEGELDGKKYTSAAHYATLTFAFGERSADAPPVKPQGAAKKSAADAAVSALAVLPEPVASFGGAVCDGYLYVYSGHTGGEHEHSKDNLSQSFQRIAVKNGAWEELPMQTPLQGLPLVAHGGKLYRIGGLSARNERDAEEDIHSVNEFASYDPATGQWTALPSLPEARSSHDAVVIGDVLYVAGGWKLTGTNDGEWLNTAWSFNLAKPDAGWESLPSPPFRRRALALAEWQGKLVALGGMTEEADVSRRVDALDLATGTWSQLADLPGRGMDGFGIGACNLGGKLYASGTQDSLYRLADDGASWEPVAALAQPRFFHRLLAKDGHSLLAVGGASQDGHLSSSEELTPARRPALEQ